MITIDKRGTNMTLMKANQERVEGDDFINYLDSRPSFRIVNSNRNLGWNIEESAQLLLKPAT
jgi:hypothetical protein